MISVICSMSRQVVRFVRLPAPLALAVGRLQRCRQLRDLFRFFGIGGRHQLERELEQIQLPPLWRRHLDRVELRGLFRISGDRVDEHLIGAGVQRLGVRRDVGGIDPVGLGRLGAEFQDGVVDLGEEPVGIRRRQAWSRPARRRSESAFSAACTGAHSDDHRQHQTLSLVHNDLQSRSYLSSPAGLKTRGSIESAVFRPRVDSRCHTYNKTDPIRTMPTASPAQRP